MHCDTRTPSEIVATVVDAITACPTRTDPACLKGAAVTLNQIGEQPCCYEGSTDCNGETWIYRFCFLTPTTYFFSITIELFPGVEASYFCISDTYAEGECWGFAVDEGANENLVGNCGNNDDCLAWPIYGHGGTVDIVAA